MARSIKKVKKPKTKKFWIILASSIFASIVAIIVGLLVWYALANTSKLERRFTEYTSIKLNENEVSDLLNAEKENDYKEVFIFVYDSTFVFDKPSVDDDDPEMKTYNQYVQAQAEFKELYELVQLANQSEREDGLKTGIFLVDASISSNSTFIGSESYDSLTSPAMLGLYLGAGDSALTYKKADDRITGKDKNGNDNKYQISGGSSVSKFISVVQEIQDYVRYTYNVELSDSAN